MLSKSSSEPGRTRARAARGNRERSAGARLARWLAVGVLLAAWTGSAAAAPLLYVVREFDPELRIVDAADASTVTTLTLSIAGETILGSSGLARDPISGDLYALLWLDGQAGRELVTLDGDTGAVLSRVGDTGDFFTALAFDSAGTLYGLTHDNALTSSSLATLSLSDATPTFETALGNGDLGEALGFSRGAGALYHASGYPGAPEGQVFERIDTTTFGVTDVPFSGDPFDEVLALGAGGGNALYMADFLGSNGVSDLFTITPHGVATFIGDLGFSDARGIAIVPEPGTGLLLAVGLALLGARRRTRGAS